MYPTFGPVGTAKLLFALIPHAMMPWDDSIRKHFGLDGSATSYRQYLQQAVKWLNGLNNECQKQGFKLDELPVQIGRPRSSLPKLMDEYHVNLREIEGTRNAEQLANLRVDYNQLPQIPKDERFYGTERVITDPHGGFIENPLVSDVQDESVLAILVKRTLGLRDAQHITQAICNSCDVFLTRDEDTIIKPHRQWIENRFPPIKVRMPSELVRELDSVT